MPDWNLYYAHTRHLPPSPLLVRALEAVQDRHAALDFGAGALRDSRFLLEQRFGQVVALDQEMPPADILADLYQYDQFLFRRGSFEAFALPTERFNLVTAQFTLPFIAPASFVRVWSDLIATLAHEGIITGQLFGERDGWHGRHASKTFHTEAQALALLAGFDILSFEAREEDGRLADGSAKHWHVFDIIARKP